MIKRILTIEGVKGVYHVADFLAVERNAKFDWQGILQQVREAFGQETEGLQENRSQVMTHLEKSKCLFKCLMGFRCR